MNFIVLVKQVPDVSNIPEEAWDKEKGTLKRALLDNILNPLDLHALTFAYRMLGGRAGSRIVALTMGPPQAKEVLIDCLSRGADDAVLLTDRGFAGADTVATAYSLSQAIRRVEKEFFAGNKDYVVVAGMQSVDGDTAQVPPQIAEELGIELIAYAQSFHFNPELEVKRIGPRGIETLTPKVYPVMITTPVCTEPLYRSFYRSRKAQAQHIHVWDAPSVGAEKDRIGIKGSRTQVYRIFSPGGEKSKECLFLDDYPKLVSLIEEKYHKTSDVAAAKHEEAYDLKGQAPSYRGEIWVYVEQEQGEIKPVSFELLGRASELARSLGEKVGAVLLGHHMGSLPQELIARGADKVYVADHPLLEDFLPTPYKKITSSLVAKYHPQIMLFGATPLGRELAPRIAYSTQSGLTADCTKLDIGDFIKGKESKIGILRQTRPALGGNIMATIMTKDAPTQMATVRPGVLKALEAIPARKGEVFQVFPEITENDVKSKIVSIEPFPTKTVISEADIIVAGGRGLGSKENFNQNLNSLVELFAQWLKGHVEIGATRMAVEEGFTTHDRQVGQTGQTVQPKLFVSVAASGAVQHISGMQNSKITLAINKDPHARIFNYADFGIVGDFETAIPKLIGAIKEKLK